MRWGTGQTVMDSCNKIYHSVENEEIPRRRERRDLPLGDGGCRQNATVCPKKLAGSSPKTSLFRTSASDLGDYGWLLRKRDVLLEPLHREEHWHIYSARVWKSFRIS